MVDINIYEIIMQMVNFLILVFILKKILYKPLLKFLDERENGIKETLEKTKKDREAAVQYLQKQEEELKKAQKEALQIRYDAEHSGKREREKIIAEAGEQTEKMVAQAKEEITAQVSKAQKGLKDEVARLSVKVAAKIIEKNIDQENQTKIIEQALQEIK